MANRKGNRQLVSLSHPEYDQQLLIQIFCSIPFCSWFGVGHSFCSLITACRPSENSSPTIRIQLSARYNPRDIQILKFHNLILAWHSALSSTNWLWLGHLLHEPQCLTPTCRAVEPPAIPWAPREGRNSYLLRSAKALEPRKSYNRSRS